MSPAVRLVYLFTITYVACFAEWRIGEEGRIVKNIIHDSWQITSDL